MILRSNIILYLSFIKLFDQISIMKYTIFILLFLLFNRMHSQSISIDRKSIVKDKIVLLIKCPDTLTIVFCQEGIEKQRKRFKGDKTFEITNKYPLLEIFAGADTTTTYINLTNKESLLPKNGLLKGLKEKEVIYL